MRTLLTSLLLIPLLLAGCGQKGPLFLPPPSATPLPAEPAPAAPADAAAAAQ